MLHHPQHALRPPRHRAPRSKTSSTTGSLFPAQKPHFVHPPGVLLRSSESRMCGSKEGGGQVGCIAEFHLGWGGLSFGRRYLVRAQAIVRSFSFPLVSFARAVTWLVVAFLLSPPHPHRCPQLKSIGVGFGALLPSVRSHVGVSPSHRLKFFYVQR